MAKFKLILLISLISLFFLLLNNYFIILSKNNPDVLVENTNTLIINPKDNKTYSIKINPPSEYDFLTKDEVYAIRKKYVAPCSSIINSDYKPSEIVYGQITDKKPWWGFLGLNCKGPGQHGIDGLSEESRFLNNPLLLLGIDSTGVIVSPGINCSQFFPELIQLLYQPSQKKITALYNISKYYRTISNTSIAHQFDLLDIKGENARDFGYNYAYAYEKNNITFGNPINLTTEVQQIRNFIHTGGSCGYPGGCNNGSPRQPEFEFDIVKLPAKIKLKLWKQKPVNKNAPADFYFDLIFQ